MEIIIRKATLSDLDNVSTLSTLLHDNEVSWHPTYRREWSFEANGKAFFAKRILGDDGVLLLACDGEKVVGYICGGWLRRYPFRNERLFAELENMYVIEGYRSKGIGKKLITEFEKWCKEKNVEKICVECVFENEKALKFYREFGFGNHSVRLEKKVGD